MENEYPLLPRPVFLLFDWAFREKKESLLIHKGIGTLPDT